MCANGENVLIVKKGKKERLEPVLTLTRHLDKLVVLIKFLYLSASVGLAQWL